VSATIRNVAPSVLRRTISAAIAALLIAGGAALSVVPANADDAEDQFIAHLDRTAVPYASKTEVIRAAKDYCLTRTRQSGSKWRATNELAKKMGWTETEANDFVQAALPSYCPNAW
jgi:hypothetical protein